MLITFLLIIFFLVLSVMAFKGSRNSGDKEVKNNPAPLNLNRIELEKERNPENPWENPWTEEDDKDPVELLNENPRLLHPEELRLLNEDLYHDMYGED